MTDRERLTTDKRKIFARESLTIMSMNKDELRKHYNEIFDRLQEYEVAEEQGQLIRLPCKVGATVFCLIDGFDAVMEGRVRFYTVHKDCIIYEVAINGYYAQRYTNKDFGYKIFFAREEAENALRGGVSDA